MVIDFQVLLFAIIVLSEFILFDELAKVVEGPRTCSMREMTHKHFPTLSRIIDHIHVHHVASDYDPISNRKNPSYVPVIFGPSLTKKFIQSHLPKSSLNCSTNTRKNPNYWRSGLININDWSKRDEQIYSLLVVIWSL